MFSDIRYYATKLWRTILCGYLQVYSPTCHWSFGFPELRCWVHKEHSIVQVRQMRDILVEKYPNSKARILKMPDAQVIAFYHRAVVNGKKTHK